MITTYEEYLEKPKSLTIEQMHEIHTEMLIGIANDSDAMELYKELIQQSTKYADFRSKWLTWDRITKIERDDSRTSCHNSLIIKFDMLARYLKSKGKEVTWRDALGYEKDDKYNRKTIGDFACYLVFINSLNAR